jgi:hypothetical protein
MLAAIAKKRHTTEGRFHTALAFHAAAAAVLLQSAALPSCRSHLGSRRKIPQRFGNVPDCPVRTMTVPSACSTPYLLR